MIGRLVQILLAAGLGVAGWWAVQRLGPELLESVDAAGWVIEAPQYAWALLAIPVMIAVRAFTLSDLPMGQQILSLFLRAGIVALVTLALVEPAKREFEPKLTTTVFVVDVSDSVTEEMLDTARLRVQAAWIGRGRHEVRLVVFAHRAEQVHLTPGSTRVADLPRLAVDSERERYTDVAGALQLAFGLMPDDRLRRVVLITDGHETRGSMVAQAETANRFGVRLHYLDLSDLPRPAELMLVDLEAPRRIKQNIPFKLRGQLQATHDGKATCELLVDDIVTETEEIEVLAGDNVVEIETKLTTGGDRKLALECKSTDSTLDRFATNNRYEVAVHVPEKPRVLYVEGEKRYRQNLVAALDRDFRVELRGARGIPSSAADAEKFDAIFISDVPRVGEMGYENFTTKQMKILEGFVRAGGGLILAGGENSFGPGGYGGTYLERKVLPVRLDVQKKEDIPELALMLVIDRSGSMVGEKLELAKEAARATLEVLQPSDKLGVVAFDSAPTEIVRLQRAANRLMITDSLRSLSPGGGTAIFPALDKAYELLASAQAKIKHIILLTDGKSRRTGILELVSQSYQDKITISTVAVGLGSDQSLLMEIAEEGGGRYYFTDRPDNIPKLFLKETSEVSRRALVEDRFRPAVVRRFKGLQMFKGTGVEKAPPLLGYISTRAKPQAEVLMTSHLGEPILARGRMGLGQVLVWTSDVKNKWAHYWLTWPGYAQFWRQVLRSSLRVEKEDPTYQVHTDVADGVLTVGVDAVDKDDRFVDGLDSEVTVSGPDGAELQVPLTQVAAGRYQGRVELPGYGAWTVQGRHSPADEPETRYRSHATVSWAFPDEYLATPPDLSPVVALAESTGGELDPSNARLFAPEGQEIEKREPWWQWPLYLVLVLLLLDILLRRIRFYGATEISWDKVRS